MAKPTYLDSVIKKLEELGKDLLEQIKRGENPRINLYSRTLKNVIFDRKDHVLKLGEKKIERDFFNLHKAKKFMQTLLVASFTKKLLSENIHASLREAFYAMKRTLPNSNENTFDEQNESDACIVDLEVTLDVLREQLHLNADTRGRVVGNVIIEDRGDTIDWSKLGSGGWAIPSNVEAIEFKKVDASFVLVIEKNAAWERLHEDKFWKKHNCILLTTQGQAPRGARRLIQRLNQEFGLPIYVFCDSDPYGFYIYSVIKYGSINLAHISDRLGTKDAMFIGLTMTDIETFKLKDWTIKAKEVDIKRAYELLNYEWFKKKEWQREINKFIEKKYKAELESLAGRGLKFVTETYLPEKIKNEDFLD
ncbi:MAG: DNA topoisomerase IV subunit A [Candidatus Aenigmatarchaeota archaeon]